jgi:Acetyltransferase (GNAT) family
VVTKDENTRTARPLPGTSQRRDRGKVSLIDGTTVRYRPIKSSDTAALRRFHDRLSDETVRLRFMNAMPHLNDQQAHYFTGVDGFDRFALVALDPAIPTEIIAVVRYDRDPGTTRAEYAAVVADQCQGRGLGLGLTHRLIDAAIVRGVRSFYAFVLPENVRMLSLLRDLGLPENVHFEDGVERVEIALVDPDLTKTKDSLASRVSFVDPLFSPRSA